MQNSQDVETKRNKTSKWTRVTLALGCVGLGLTIAHSDAKAGVEIWENEFEGREASVWWFGGTAGIDVSEGLAHTDANNGWVRATAGWNSVNTWVSTYPGGLCTASAWLRTSSTLTQGYMSIRSASVGMPILNEIHVVGNGSPNYSQYKFTFYADAFEALFYVGLWGNGQDSWIQVDDVVISCPNPF